jgi:hypothetical protein
MDIHQRIVAVIATVGLLLVVVDLVRRRRLLERYALVWLGVTLLLIVLALWDGLLLGVASVIGIFYPPSALFVIAFGFIIVLLLNLSVAVSRLTDQSKVLAQQVGLLEERMRRQEARSEARGAPAEEAELERSEA